MAPPQRLYPGLINGPQRAHRHDAAIPQRLFRLLRTRRAAGSGHIPLPGSAATAARPSSASMFPVCTFTAARRKLCTASPSARQTALGTLSGQRYLRLLDRGRGHLRRGVFLTGLAPL